MNELRKCKNCQFVIVKIIDIGTEKHPEKFPVFRCHKYAPRDVSIAVFPAVEPDEMCWEWENGDTWTTNVSKQS